jgi:hypothetical protein
MSRFKTEFWSCTGARSGRDGAIRTG